ncbi:MAG: hypothetical protein WBL19_01320 [Minisyncoccia bacterium]
MEILKNGSHFSFWEKVGIVFVPIGLVLIVLTMPNFGMPRWYHLALSVMGVVLFVTSFVMRRRSFGPTGMLIGFVVAVICYSVYEGYIVQ